MTDSATATRPYPDKWARESATPTVEAYHSAVRKLVAERFAASGKSWEEAVQDPSFELTREDFEKVEADLLASGYRFEMSATVSLKEEPDKYKPLEGVQDSGQQETDEQGRKIVGSGDNVFRAKADVEGTAVFVSDVEKVMELLTEGVKPETVAVIDDSGGTLTAPILEGFKAVVCKGGSVRSHLGILTREYRIPCLMASEVRGLKDGDRVQVEYSVAAKIPYERDASQGRARVWRLP